MNGKQRIPLARARIIAGEVVDLLSPVCERIEVAGSVRRQKATVGDIEILCASRVRHETQMDLFGQATGPTHTYSELDELCTRLLADKRLNYRLNAVGHRAGWGDHNKLAWYHSQDGSQPTPLDIFTVYPNAGEQWGVAQVIRTGPKEFNKALIAIARANGLRVQVSDWTLRDTAVRVVSTPEESDVFDAVGLPWIPPAERSARKDETASMFDKAATRSSTRRSRLPAVSCSATENEGGLQ